MPVKGDKDVSDGAIVDVNNGADASGDINDGLNVDINDDVNDGINVDVTAGAVLAAVLPDDESKDCNAG